MKTDKYVRIDPNNPAALGVCDYSGFVFNRKDLVKQMEWRGNRLCWTGFYVGKPFLDKPNPQLKPPLLKADPVPVKDPRPLFYSSSSPSESQKKEILEKVYFGGW